MAKKKKTKKRRQPVEKPERKYPTHNAKVIAELMASNRVRGNFKDHVILIGCQIMDWKGTFVVTREEDGGTVGINAMAIIHKSKLRNIIGEEQAARFWNPKLGRIQTR